MKKIIAAAVLLMFVGATGLVFADNHTPLANKRMHNQKKRIKQGVRSGELTKGETKELAQDHQALRQEIRGAKSDGKVTKDERKQIQKDENAESKKINDLKHNDEKRPGAK